MENITSLKVSVHKQVRINHETHMLNFTGIFVCKVRGIFGASVICTPIHAPRVFYYLNLENDIRYHDISAYLKQDARKNIVLKHLVDKLHSEKYRLSSANTTKFMNKVLEHPEADYQGQLKEWKNIFKNVKEE